MSVRRSGWCRRRHPLSTVLRLPLKRCPSIRLVPTSAPLQSCLAAIIIHVSVDQVGADVGTQGSGDGADRDFMCPSIRLVPTSAPRKRWCCAARFSVSVDQVGADVGTPSGATLTFGYLGVRRSGWCRRRHRRHAMKRMVCTSVSVDQVGADVGTPQAQQSAPPPARCPSIRLVPTSAPRNAE